MYGTVCTRRRAAAFLRRCLLAYSLQLLRVCPAVCNLLEQLLRREPVSRQTAMLRHVCCCRCSCGCWRPKVLLICPNKPCWTPIFVYQSSPDTFQEVLMCHLPHCHAVFHLHDAGQG
eukprot:GHRQ01030159.1.p2 GENE.GHRQ01030159.1~~GHRQ01030159.1.p2  ORF type:complete len:117 (-),score=14.59 GHRQ01030159.1:749-1099(-)